jgi:oligopeptide transport system substrate-binding protein
MLRTLPRTIAAIFCAFTTSIYSAAIPPGTILAAKQEMVRNNGFEPESLDPALVESTAAGAILADLFETLTAINNHGKVVPGAAESWQQTGPTTWLFKLRKGALWSNGEPVIAEDFVYGWRRLVDPKNAAPLASTYGGYLLNGEAIAQGKRPLADLGAHAVDRNTLEVQTSSPLPFLPFILALASFSPSPRTAIETFGKNWTKPGNLVSNGAYVLKDWQVNSKVVVDKNPRYWDAANVTLTRVTYLAVEDSNSDLKLYQSGENDMMFRLPAGTYEALRSQYPKEMHNSLLIGQRFYFLNNTDMLLKDVRVRKALSMVIDREVLAGRVTADGQQPQYGLTVRSNEGAAFLQYEWANWPMDKRIAVARKLLLDAGVKPNTHLRLSYNTSDYNKRMAIFTASEWKTKLEFDIEMEAMEFKVLLAKVHAGEYQISRASWTPGFPDVTGFLQLVECGADANDNKNCNPDADKLIRQASATTDQTLRKTLMTKALRLEMEDYPMIPLLQLSVPRLVKPWIGGYDDSNDQDTFRSKDFYVVKH